jgi:hypothetical protein
MPIRACGNIRSAVLRDPGLCGSGFDSQTASVDGTLEAGAPQGHSGSRMHDRQNVRDINVTFEFGTFIGCQGALVRFVHQFLHARAIGLAEIHGQKITGASGKIGSFGAWISRAQMTGSKFTLAGWAPITLSVRQYAEHRRRRAIQYGSL